jgi:hypothetical protein
MRKFFLLVFISASLRLAAQESLGSFYVAIKGGLSIREKPDASAKVLDKIPYGTKINLLQPPQEIKPIITEGMEGQWKKVNYNSKTGYVLNSYVLPWPPPKLATVKEMKQYLAQVTLPFGAKLVVKKGTMNNIQEGGWQMNKQLYKNGAEWQEFIGYEYGSDVYFLPDFTMQQAFLLLRLLPEFKPVFDEKEEFPTQSRNYKKGELEYELVIEKEMLGDSPWVKKIKLQYSDGAYYTFEMYYVDNQVVIFYSSGV